jgi:hypothetical protein
MFAFLKAIVVGAIFSFVLSALIGHAGSTGGLANIHHFVIQGFSFHWSWVLFVAGSGLAFVIFLMLE